MAINNKFKTVDFSTGIFARNIQENFDIAKGLFDRERLRIGGYGIVEGFELEVLPNMQVKISAGILINKEGEEIIIDERIVRIPDPKFSIIDINNKDDALQVNSQGQFVIPHRPYSDIKKGCFTTDFYQNAYPTGELVISSANNPDTKIRAIRINDNMITIDVNAWAMKKVLVKYQYSGNRIDALLINEKGEFKIGEGIFTTSPSHVDLEQYDGYLVIGLVGVNIGETIELIPYNDYKTFRRVFVDKNNKLYLNGKPYKEIQAIHFEEPEDPQINDLWYDKNTNKLLIWRNDNGVYGWSAVNEEMFVPIKEVKIFSPDKFPEDGQTFLFDKDEINLNFIPGHNQLEIIIDNAPLMSDQYEEIIDKSIGDCANSGVGFKLKTPLERATHVEVRIMHTVKVNPLRNTFQRTATFAHENFIIYESTNTNKVFETDYEYIIGESQLQVYVNGNRLDLRVGHYSEILKPDGVIDTKDKGMATKLFKILKELTPGDIVSYRVERNIYSYDQLDKVISNVEGKVDKAADDIIAINNRIDIMAQNLELKFKAIDDSILQIATKLEDQNSFIKKTDKLTMENLSQELISSLFSSTIEEHRPAESVVILENVKTTDSISIAYISSGGIKPLIANIDYTKSENENNLYIMLNSALVDNANSLYITGIKFGR